MSDFITIHFVVPEIKHAKEGQMNKYDLLTVHSFYVRCAKNT